MGLTSEPATENIKVRPSLKRQLLKMKLTPRDTFDAILTRILKASRKTKG